MAIRKRLIWGVYRNLTKGVFIFFHEGGDYFLKVAISQAKFDEKHVLYILKFTCQGLQKKYKWGEINDYCVASWPSLESWTLFGSMWMGWGSTLLFLKTPSNHRFHWLWVHCIFVKAVFKSSIIFLSNFKVFFRLSELAFALPES